jgi:hypothetical protein
MQVSLNIKMADHVMKHTSVKGNNVPKSIKHCKAGRTYFVSWGKHLKVKTTETQQLKLN